MAKLPRVVEVMPYAVESADYRSLGSHESITHPYGEYGVLLSQSLTGCNRTDRLPSLLNRVAAGSRAVTASDETT